MKHLLLAAAFAWAVTPAAAEAREEPAALEQLRKELIEAETQLYEFQRLIPPDFDLAAERERIDRSATDAKLSPVEVKVVPGSERLRTRDGQAVPLEIHRLEISGTDPYDAVHFFLSILRLRPRLVGIESLTLDAGGGGDVRFVARLTYPSWIEMVDENSVRSDVVTLMRQKLARTRAIRDGVATAVGRARNDLLRPFGAFTKEVEGLPIALTAARIDESLTMQGFVLGTAARGVVKDALRKTKLRARIESAQAGSCESVAITAQLEPAGNVEEVAASGYEPAANIFDRESDAFCRGQSPGPPRKIVAGDMPGDAFLLRLRDVDARDVFLVLNELIDEDFLVDDDVAGRIDLDVDSRATLGELFRALGKAGLSIGGGPIRRVSRRNAVASPPPGAGGDPVTFKFRDADLSDILCLISRLSEREILMPPAKQRRVSLFATEQPLGVFEALLVPARDPTAIDACDVPGTPRSRLAAKQWKFEELAIRELRLAGLSNVGGARQAYVYVPGGRLLTLETGAQFADGIVRSIDAKGIKVAGAENRIVEIPLVP